MAVSRFLLPVAAVAVAAVLALSGCSSSPTIAGVWGASDGTPTKVISDNGQCTGMYYNGSTPLDIGGGMTCTLSSGQGGSYQLVVSQPPNQIVYDVQFDGDTMTLISGGATIVTLTRQ